MELRRGLSYLFEGPNSDQAYASFRSLMSSGVRGLCLTRHNPEFIKERYELFCPVIWLARTERFSDRYQNVHPEHILKIHTIVNAFLRIDGDSAILLDGLEYLVTHNDFTSVLKLISLINERVAMANALLLIPVNPTALEPKELGILERECQKIGDGGSFQQTMSGCP
jgi:hypothetical protein